MTEDFNYKVLEAFGDTEDIKKALKLNPHDLFYFLFDKFNFYNDQLPKNEQGEYDIDKYTDLHVQLSNLVMLQSDVLLYLGLYVKRQLMSIK